MRILFCASACTSSTSTKNAHAKQEISLRRAGIQVWCLPVSPSVPGMCATFAHGGKGEGSTRMLGMRCMSRCLEWCQSTQAPDAGGNTGYMCRCCKMCWNSLAMRSPCGSYAESSSYHYIFAYRWRNSELLGLIFGDQTVKFKRSGDHYRAVTSTHSNGILM